MKLIKEFLLYIFPIILGLNILSEIITSLILGLRLDDILEETKNDSLSITKNRLFQINDNLSNLFFDNIKKICHELLLVGKHMDLIINETENNSPKIMKGTKFYNSYSNCIVPFNEIMNHSDIMKYYNNETKSLNFIDGYLKEYENNYETNYIINEMLHKSELNKISYYKFPNSSNFSEFEPSACFLVSILKAQLIQSFIMEREKYEYVRWSLILNDSLFLYPPHFFYSSMSYAFAYIYYTECTYDYYDILNEYIFTNYPSCLNVDSAFSGTENNFVIVKPEIINENTGMVICMKIPFVYELSENYKPVLCVEILLTNFLNKFYFDGGDTINVNFFTTSLINKYQPFNLNQKLISIFFINDEKLRKEIYEVYKDSKFQEYETFSNTSEITLFHHLYVDIFSNSNFTPAIDMKKIFEEYQNILQMFEIKLNNIITKFDQNNSIEINKLDEYFTINKTICYIRLFSKSPRCKPDFYQILIHPIIVNFTSISDNFIINEESRKKQIIFFSLNFVKIRSNYIHYYFNSILKKKIYRIFIFLFMFSSGMLLVVYLICRIILDWLLDSLIRIKKELNFFEEFDEFSESLSKIKNLKEKEKIFNKENYFYKRLFKNNLFPKNIEMKSLTKIFETMKKIHILKQVINNNQNMQNLKKEYFSFLQTIDDHETKQFCTLIYAYSLFQHKEYKLSERELKNLLAYINKKEKYILNENNNYENQVKDMIQRFNDTFYINDYTQLKGLNETILPIIKSKQTKQKILYLYGLNNYYISKSQKNKYTSFNRQKFTIINNNNNSNISIDKNLHEALNAFKEAKKINQILGMNPIREIYCLIMMAKCQIQNKVYREAIEYINESNILFVNLITLFKQNQNRTFNPQIMLFVFNNIFQTIMLTTAQCAQLMGKSNAVDWIIFKMFQTSPFVLEHQHLIGSKLILNSLRTLERNKNNKKLSKIIQNAKKLYSKIFARINIRNSNYIKKNKTEGQNNINSNTKHSNSYKKLNNLVSRNSEGIQNNLNSSLLRESQIINSNTSQAIYLQDLSQTNFRNMKKEITICISEKTLMEINGLELKDIFIKYFQKFFVNNEFDKFGYLQFSNNGKKTIYIKPQKLENFIQKIQENKNYFEVNENNNYKCESQFNDLFNILETIIKQENREETTDNIILIFINSEDIRFTNKEECINIVNELNNNNFSLYIFCNDNEINKNKIENIKMFLGGLFEGYFIHFKNYQILKQVLMNLSIIKKEENFFTFCFENMDCFI